MPQRTTVTELPTKLHNFAADVSRLVYPARCEYINRLLAQEKDSIIIKDLQVKYGINKRQANAIRCEALAAISLATLCRKEHIKKISSQIKSTFSWLKKQKKKLKTTPIACSLKTRRTLQSNKKFAIHQKKRRLYLLQNKLAYLLTAPLKVTIGQKKTQYMTVGSKGESKGNQIAQYDDNNIVFRVPYGLEAKYGKYIYAPLKFPYKSEWIEDAIKNNRALTYRIYAKDFRWFIACSTEVPQPEKTSYSTYYGCIGIDINPNVIGIARTDKDGNLKETRQIKFNLHSRRTNPQLAILHDVCNEIVDLCVKNKCPLVLEKLDFTAKKAQMREKGTRYSRMLSYFSYGKITELLIQKTQMAGIEIIFLSPAYSSVIGLVKYLKLYGLSSDTASALVLARRAMRLSERVPLQNAYPIMTMGKHVWSAWYALNKKLNKQLCLRRHSYFSLSNRELEVMLEDEFLAIAKKGSSSKRKRTSRIRCKSEG
ncbi:MAG: IS200/IS605 family accessory protein TnpB-related protein [Xenococcaceae cyanobacterium MO_207.B15]|nr:IS200/IS605 family accessory protein TnpB-related protein [Xenococcaceae cyanobacterium MO_207.B15]